MIDYYETLEEGQYYHIYNRGNNGENIFFKAENYNYFLKKFDSYLSDCVEVYSYCLLPNHFHFLIRIKENLTPIYTLQKKYETADEIVCEKFRRFFMSYAKAINVQEKRTGSLFIKIFKRKKVVDEFYFCTLVNYIHTNPKKHGIFEDYENYPYSSYQRILIDTPTKLQKDTILEMFNSTNEYVSSHKDFIHKTLKNIDFTLE